MIQRTGEVVIRMLENVQQVTIGPLIRAMITPGSVVYTDEYDIYARLDDWRGGLDGLRRAGFLVLALLFVRMFFVTAGYHRYFSHRSFKTSRVFQFVIAFMAMTSSQKGVLWWAAHHRHHHRHSDQELDLHSPTLFGFFWSHVGWIISDKYNDTRTEYIADFAKYPELRWLNKYHLIPPVARISSGSTCGGNILSSAPCRG